MPEVLGAARVTEWWEHKLAVVAGTGYAAAAFADRDLVDAAGDIVLVLLALLPGALFVSVLNDLTDREADRLAGKHNRLDGRSRAAWATVAAAAVAAGAIVAAVAWRDDPAALVLYAGAWIAFALYSAPPVRLKGRGFAGVAADAAGAHLFPHLLMVAVVLDGAGEAIDVPFAVAVGAWAFAAGLRGVIWHQLRDVDADARAGVRTFGGSRPERARSLATFVVFPVELVAFAVLLVLAGGWLCIALLPAYALLEVMRARRRGTAIVVVAGTGDHRIVMHDFYVAFYPLAFAVAATVEHPADAIVLAVHLALFSATPREIAADALRAVRRLRPAPAR